MRYSTFFTSMSLLVIPGAALAADCRPAFVGGDQAVTIDGVQIEPGAKATESFQVRVRDASSPAGGPGNSPGMGGPAAGGPCSATIRVSRLGVPTDPAFPPYDLLAPGNSRIEILPEPTAGGTPDSDVTIANVPPGPQGRAVPLRVRVDTEWGLRSGTYVEQLQLLLVDDEGEIVDRSNLTITIIIPPAVSLRFVGAVIGGGAYGPARIDLGNLSSTHDTRSERFGARIFSTAPYTVRFSSSNQGDLLHEQSNDRIPYRLFFDGALVDLKGSPEVSYPERTPATGDRRPMRIVVPAIVAPAGRYSDRITVSVSAL
ncbi:hypothetical protein [Qipengyuania sp. YIM B01966]|uniref:hypothetical protein n=1 Tax=Qipengyuania sp. YIM B01966 TaxID=2778646 RepID=UPI0018F44791|nr:hypothetical protein [Qipengyuania sp. YIM B01966]